MTSFNSVFFKSLRKNNSWEIYKILEDLKKFQNLERCPSNCAMLTNNINGQETLFSWTELTSILVQLFSFSFSVTV